MQYKTIEDIINSGKFTETKFRYDYKKPYGVQIQQETKKLGLPEDYYTIYVTNIFVDTHKEKYKNAIYFSDYPKLHLVFLKFYYFASKIYSSYFAFY